MPQLNTISIRHFASDHLSRTAFVMRYMTNISSAARRVAQHGRFGKANRMPLEYHLIPLSIKAASAVGTYKILISQRLQPFTVKAPLDNTGRCRDNDNYNNCNDLHIHLILYVLYRSG